MQRVEQVSFQDTSSGCDSRWQHHFSKKFQSRKLSVTGELLTRVELGAEPRAGANLVVYNVEIYVIDNKREA